MFIIKLYLFVCSIREIYEDQNMVFERGRDYWLVHTIFYENFAENRIQCSRNEFKQNCMVMVMEDHDHGIVDQS